MAEKIYLGGINYELGEVHGIDNLEGDKDSIELLRSMGISNFCKAERTVQELAYDSIKKTVALSDIDPTDVETVILATTSMSLKENVEGYSLIDKVLEDTGMVNAFPYGMFMSNCSNLTSSIKTAMSILKDSERSYAIVCVADKLTQDKDRFMNSNESILSDGAVSVIVSKKPLEYLVRKIAIKRDFQYLRKEFNVLEFFQNNADNVKKIWDELGGFELDFDQVFFGNYNLLALRGFISQLKLDKRNVFLKNISRLGHVFSADQLINLKDYNSKKGDDLALITSGYYRWGVIFIEKL